MKSIAGGVAAAALLIPKLHAETPLKAQWRQILPLPDPCGFASPYVGVCHNHLLIAGGANFPDKQLWEGGKKTWHDRAFILQPGGNIWKEAGHLPIGPRGYGVSITTPEGVICAGGSDQTQHYADCFILNLENGGLTVQQLPPLPRPLALCAGANVNGILYVAGGLESPSSREALNVFYALDLSTPGKGWKELPTWPGEGRFQAVAATDGKYFYLFSGLRFSREKISYLKDAYRFSPNEGWEKLPDLPHPAAAAASPAPVDPQGIIHLIGGVDGDLADVDPSEFREVPQRIQSYNPSSKSWNITGNAPGGRVCVSTTEWQGDWILPTGERSAGIRSPEIWSVRWINNNSQ